MSINHLTFYNNHVLPVMHPNVGDVIETIANIVFTFSRGYFKITFIQLVIQNCIPVTVKNKITKVVITNL